MRLGEGRETVDGLRGGGGEEGIDLVEDDGVEHLEGVLAIHFKVTIRGQMKNEMVSEYISQGDLLPPLFFWTVRENKERK